MKPVKLLIVAALAAEAQQPAKVHRIAWLGLASPTPDVLRSMDGFRQALSELGYVEEQNIVLEYRWAHGHIERLPDLKTAKTLGLRIPRSMILRADRVIE